MNFVFVIPNVRTEFGALNRNETQRLIESLDLKINGEPVVLQDDDVPVELWFSSEECDNWSCDQLPEPIPLIGKGELYNNRLPGSLPRRFFENLHEGETVTLSVRGVDTQFVASQASSRYRDHGKFEEVFEHVRG